MSIIAAFANPEVHRIDTLIDAHGSLSYAEAIQITQLIQICGGSGLTVLILETRKICLS